MGLLDRVRYAGDVTAAAVTRDPGTLPIASPWVSEELERIIFNDVLGSVISPDVPLNSRRSAMRIPAVARARNLLCTAAARAVIRAMRVEQVIPSPSWMTAAAAGASPQLRMIWTVDDLIFYGDSLWWRSNGVDRFPLVAGRVNRGDWRINDDNRIEIDGVAQPDSAVIYIPGWHNGILDHGRDELRDARSLRDLVKRRLLNPVPQLELHQTEGTPLTETEIKQLVADWAAARMGLNGGVAFTPRGLEVNEHGADTDSQLAIEARNASAVEIARVVGIAAGLLDATAPKASLNYETTQLRNQEFIDRDLAGYLDPIAARLSMDDVSPHGTRVAFDLTDMQTATPTGTGPSEED